MFSKKLHTEICIIVDSGLHQQQKICPDHQCMYQFDWDDLIGLANYVPGVIWSENNIFSHCMPNICSFHCLYANIEKQHLNLNKFNFNRKKNTTIHPRKQPPTLPSCHSQSDMTWHSQGSTNSSSNSWIPATLTFTLLALIRCGTRCVRI